MPDPADSPPVARLAAAAAGSLAADPATPPTLPPAPVERWHPPHCGRLDLRIARSGSWYYQGGAIRRLALVRLFARILRREADGSYCLVTPVERWTITVEDLPFLAVDFEVEIRAGRPVLVFATSLGDRVGVDADHPLSVAFGPGDVPAPAVELRRGLAARIDRKSFLRLVALCRHETVGGVRQFGFESAGLWFPLAPSAMLDADAA